MFKTLTSLLALAGLLYITGATAGEVTCKLPPGFCGGNWQTPVYGGRNGPGDGVVIDEGDTGAGGPIIDGGPDAIDGYEGD